jgi:hypothetical protein
MKTLMSTIIIAAATAIPAVSFAQQANDPLTRAQVRAQLDTAQQKGLVHQSKTQFPKAAPLNRGNVPATDTSGYGLGIGGRRKQLRRRRRCNVHFLPITKAASVSHQYWHSIGKR